MHKRPVKTIEVQQVIFQKDGQVHNRQVAMDDGQNASQVQEEREE